MYVGNVSATLLGDYSTSCGIRIKIRGAEDSGLIFLETSKGFDESQQVEHEHTSHCVQYFHGNFCSHRQTNYHNLKSYTVHSVLPVLIMRYVLLSCIPFLLSPSPSRIGSAHLNCTPLTRPQFMFPHTKFGRLFFLTIYLFYNLIGLLNYADLDKNVDGCYTTKQWWV